MKSSLLASAAALLALLLLAPACQVTGSVLGRTIADLDAPFAILDLSFNT